MRWVMKFFYDVGDTARTLLVEDLQQGGERESKWTPASGFRVVTHYLTGRSKSMQLSTVTVPRARGN